MPVEAVWSADINISSYCCTCLTLAVIFSLMERGHRLSFDTQAANQRSRLTARLDKKGIKATTVAPRNRPKRRIPKRGESILDEKLQSDPEVDSFLLVIFLFISVFGILLALVYVAPGLISRVTGLKLVRPVPIPQGLTFNQGPE